LAQVLPTTSTHGSAPLASRVRSWRRVMPWIVVGLMWTLVWGWVMVPYWIKFPVPDESTFLYGGWRLLHGQLPYRDFFTFLLPGSFWVVEAIYRAVGVDLAVCRTVAMGVWLLSVGLTAWLGRRYLTPWAMALLVAWFTLVHVPHHIEIQHHSLSALLGLVAVGLASLAVSNPRRSLAWASLSGLAMGVCALMTYSLAGVLGVALGVWWWLWEARSAISAQALPSSRVRLWQAYTLGALLPVVAGVGVLLAQGVGADLWTNTIGWLLDGRYSQTTSHWFYLDGFTKLAGLTPYWLQHPGDLSRLTEWWFWALQGALPVLGLLWPVFYARDAWRRDRQPGGRAAHGVMAWMTTWATRDWMLLLLGFSGLAFFVAVFSYPNSGLLAFHGWLPRYWPSSVCKTWRLGGGNFAG
jgi:hypothetical protein